MLQLQLGPARRAKAADTDRPLPVANLIFNRHDSTAAAPIEKNCLVEGSSRFKKTSVRSPRRPTMAHFVIGGRVGGLGRERDRGRRAISCIYEDDEGPHSLDRFLRTGALTGFRNRTEPDPFLSLQLHSEYRSTYRWHEFTPKQPGSGSGQDVVRNPPQPSAGKSPSNLISRSWV